MRKSSAGFGANRGLKALLIGGMNNIRHHDNQPFGAVQLRFAQGVCGLPPYLNAGVAVHGSQFSAEVIGRRIGLSVAHLSNAHLAPIESRNGSDRFEHSLAAVVTFSLPVLGRERSTIYASGQPDNRSPGLGGSSAPLGAVSRGVARRAGTARHTARACD